MTASGLKPRTLQRFTASLMINKIGAYVGNAVEESIRILELMPSQLTSTYHIPILIVAFLKVPVSNPSLIPKEELPTRNRLIADIS